MQNQNGPIDGNLRVEVNGGYKIGTTIINDGAWHHVVILRAGGLARNYVDGVQVGSDIAVTTGLTAVDPGGLFIGQDQDVLGGGFQTRKSWAGRVDNFRIYSRALSSSEVQLLSVDAR